MGFDRNNQQLMAQLRASGAVEDSTGKTPKPKQDKGPFLDYINDKPKKEKKAKKGKK